VRCAGHPPAEVSGFILISYISAKNTAAACAEIDE
jgi:hypothetical protein